MLSTAGLLKYCKESPEFELMKNLLLLILTFSTAACANLGTLPGPQGHQDSDAEEPSIAAPLSAPALQDQNAGPQIILPATGGVPVIGIPLGGDIFLPVTGGPPVIGIPTGP